MQALVSVYQKLLEFFVSAYGLLMTRGAILVLAVISNADTLPDIAKDFLKQAEHLQKIVDKAILDIFQDIKALLYDEKSHDKPPQQSRHHAILLSLRADSACGLPLEKPQFKTWYRAFDSQQLAILGDIRSGKSVTMGFLIDELCRRRNHQLPQPMILYHYYQNDETGHALYIFSSLILSLLEQRVRNFELSTNAHKLADFFQRTAEELDRPLYLIIDGLDECDTKSRGILFKFLQSPS
ncbi:uncharacterized protein TrAtP1_001703 [Trichoderma atroviride]|uniref:uncharacterized protein n=1 Tax=Hypocrea atroviridis TaxID=63577 RepID=UPI00331EE7B6|nr:hypothetical protein TrAtP1_001703 [Trichoderma atroviride]